MAPVDSRAKEATAGRRFPFQTPWCVTLSDFFERRRYEPLRFEMYEIRQVIQRLLRAKSDRDVARAQRVGRKTVAWVRRQAFEQGWQYFPILK